MVLPAMTDEEIDKIIRLARHAYMSRSDYDGLEPVVADSDIVQLDGEEAVMLCAGDEVIAYYVWSPEGRLRYAPPR